MTKSIGKMLHYNTDRFVKIGPYETLRLDWDNPFIDRYGILPHYLPVTPYSQPLEYQSSDRKSTRLNSSHIPLSRMPSSA